MNAQSIVILIVFAVGALYFGVELVKSVDDIKSNLFTFILAFIVAAGIGFVISYFLTNGYPEEGIVEFFEKWGGLFILGLIGTFVGSIYFFPSFNGSFKFICAAILIGLSIGACVYDHNYIVLIVTVVLMLIGFVSNRSIQKVKKHC